MSSRKKHRDIPQATNICHSFLTKEMPDPLSLILQANSWHFVQFID